MTTRELTNLKPGDTVHWVDGSSGTVSADAHLNNQKPHYVIVWADGQITDGRDDAALEMVSLARQ